MYGGDATARDQIAQAEIIANQRFELIGCIAIAVTNNDLVAGHHQRTTAVESFDLTMLTQLVNRGKYEVPCGRLDTTSDQSPHIARRNATRGERTLRLSGACAPKSRDFHMYPSKKMSCSASVRVVQ